MTLQCYHRVETLIWVALFHSVSTDESADLKLAEKMTNKTLLKGMILDKTQSQNDLAHLGSAS